MTNSTWKTVTFFWWDRFIYDVVHKGFDMFWDTISQNSKPETIDTTGYTVPVKGKEMFRPYGTIKGIPP